MFGPAAPTAFSMTPPGAGVTGFSSDAWGSADTSLRVSSAGSHGDAGSAVLDDPFHSDADRSNEHPPKTHAVPSAGYLDKLWSQIDVLDDVKSMLNEIRSKGSFFDEKFNAEFAHLKLVQRKLLDIVTVLSLDASSTTAGNTTDQSERLRHFFADDEDEDANPSNVLHRKQNFEEMELYVEEMRLGLTQVASAMKKFDELARDTW